MNQTTADLKTDFMGLEPSLLQMKSVHYLKLLQASPSAVFYVRSGSWLCENSDISQKLEVLPAFRKFAPNGINGLVHGGLWCSGGSCRNWEFSHSLGQKRTLRSCLRGVCFVPKTVDLSSRRGLEITGRHLLFDLAKRESCREQAHAHGRPHDFMTAHAVRAVLI